jgi:hypothetical protein
VKGSGTILGNLNVIVGSTIDPGDAIGTLTVQNNITLNGTLQMEFNRINSQPCDQLVSSVGSIATGGTLVVTNLGPPLQPGGAFPLFQMPVSGFTTTSLPSLSANCAWINHLTVDGTIRVISAVPTNITVLTTNDMWMLSWPGDRRAWTLQTQTNSPDMGLGTNWIDVPNSTRVSQLPFPVDPADGCVFFRLIYP